MNKIEKKIIERFEANMLDGYKVNDCGRAMISPQECLDYLLEELAQQRKEIIEKIRVLENANTEDNSISLADRFCKNDAYDEVIKAIK